MQEQRRDLIWIVRISLVMAIGLVVYFAVLTIVIPVSNFKIEIPEKKSAVDKILIPDQEWLLSLDDSLKNSVYNLLSSESFLISKLALTADDSISMIVSLKDSIVDLVVQGVTIYSTKIRSYKISQALIKTDPVKLAQWLSSPFLVNEYISSIPKVPVLYKKAPKDTIEAMSQLELDPLKDELDPVQFSLHLDPKLTLNFEQIEPADKGNIRQLSSYKKKLKSISRKEIFNHLLRAKPIEFVPEIEIVIDQKAARVIYRALPVDALVSLQLSAF